MIAISKDGSAIVPVMDAHSGVAAKVFTQDTVKFCHEHRSTWLGISWSVFWGKWAVLMVRVNSESLREEGACLFDLIVPWSGFVSKQTQR